MSAPRITDHALVRFLDRATGLDVEQLRARLAQSLAEANAAAIRLGVPRYRIVADGFVFFVEHGVVKTVAPARRRKGKRRPPRPRADA